MITPRLPQRAVVRYLDQLKDDLAPRQLQRLRLLADAITDDGGIPLDQALALATPGGNEQTAQAAFRKFRAAVNEAIGETQVDLRLVVDGRKTAPQGRSCWFEGTDTADVELAELSAKGVRRGSGDRLVAPTVAEVLDAPLVTTVYVSIARDPAERVRHQESEFVRLLRDLLALRRDRTFRVTSAHDIELGRDIAASRRELVEQADVVLVLVSTAYLLDSGGDSSWLAATRCRPVLVALGGLPPGPLDDQGLPLAETYQRPRPFSARNRQMAKEEFVHECQVLIETRLADRAWTTGLDFARGAEGGGDLSRWLHGRLARDFGHEHIVASYVGVTDFAEQLGGGGTRPRGQRVHAIERLAEWATDRTEATYLCALLGDVGMGKTTTTRLLTEHLLRSRADDPSVPLPILFDLRDLPRPVATAAPNLRRIIEALLDATEVPGRRPSADDVLGQVAAGNCVLIFEGLDEVLVHLDPRQGQMFTRTLWRATEDTWQISPAGQPRSDAPSKLLLTCRTHYFRSIRDETTHFTGQHRDGPPAREYLALLMLPFDEQQIREYLRTNVPGREVEALLDTIDSVHNLREIAERPLTLRMITEQLTLIEQTKLDGREVQAVDLYASFVDQWLGRDDGKHSLLPEHKQLVMEHLAAQLWRSGETAWTVHDVERLLLEFLAGRRDLELHYATRDPTLWKEDLRTATFLVRRDDDAFTFAHTSLREYFLSRYLLRALEPDASDAPRRWSMPIPSRETLAFLGQHLAGLDAQRRQSCLNALAALAVTDGAAAVLAFGYGLAAVRVGYPHHRLGGSRLNGLDLRGWRIGADDGRLLDLRHISFAGADLSNAVLDMVDLRDADLTGAILTRTEVLDSDLRGADLSQARLTGTVLRNCALDGARWDRSTAYRAQALRCRPTNPPNRSGWLVAPNPGADIEHARCASFTGHTGWVVGGVFSPDGTRVLTTSGDATGRVWDAVGGELLHTLTGHTRAVGAGVFSPDGTRVLTTSNDATGRIWDAVSGEQIAWQLEQLPGGEIAVWSVPD
ncbi:MAG: NACHT domain-containing protein, partial [Pseudonocardiaceae bacterium]